MFDFFFVLSAILLGLAVIAGFIALYGLAMTECLPAGTAWTGRLARRGFSRLRRRKPSIDDPEFR